MILPTRLESPGLNGRRSTRDWSGLRIVEVRLTWIDMGPRDTRKKLLSFCGERLLETRQHILGRAHFGQGKQEGQSGFCPLIPVDPIHV
jgi:hypothetical protein